MSPEESQDSSYSSKVHNMHQVQLIGSGRTVLRYFSEYDHGKTVLDIIVQVAIATFMSYPGEKFLQVWSLVKLLSS